MQPINRILVPTDFSDRATRALKYAVHLAQAAEAHLFILHAYQLPVATVVGYYPVSTAAPINPQQIHDEVHETLETLAQDHLSDRCLPYKLLSMCDLPEAAIEKTVDEHDIDLIVMGMRGGGAVNKLVGSTTTRVMRQVTCPLIAVPENAVFTQVKHILLATDYQRVKHADTFQILVTLANVFRAQIDVLHITAQHAKLTPENLSAGSMIDRLLRHARHTYCHVENDDIFRGLRAYLREREEEIGMLAMVPRNHNLWERIARGSMTRNMLFEADRPVFVVRE